MKKIVILMLLLLFATLNAHSMQACKCQCGYREMQAVDYLKIPAVMSGILAGPAYMNYMLYKEKNMSGLYIYDAALFSTAVVALVSGDALDGKISETALTASFITATAVVWGYSCITMINGIFQNDGEKTGRGTLGFIAGPAVFVAAFLLTLDCRCRPENECISFSPAVGPDYAGLRCSLKF